MRLGGLGAVSVWLGVAGLAVGCSDTTSSEATSQGLDVAEGAADGVSSDASGTPRDAADLPDNGPQGAGDAANGDASLDDASDPQTAHDALQPPPNDATDTQTAHDTVEPSADAASPDTQPPFVLDCATYCDVVESACVAFPPYADHATCLAACAALPLGVSGSASGNNVACRYGRALLAAEGGPSVAARCLAAGPTGGGVCGQPCDAYCSLAQGLCAGTVAPAGCATACAKYPTDASTGATSGDSLACRFSALLDGRCADAGPSGGQVCLEPPPPGDTCAWPYVVSALPYTLEGDTSDATDDLWYEGGVCGGEFGGKGGKGAVDEVVAWTATETTEVTATLKAKQPYDSILYVLSECTDPTASCLEKRDSVGFQATETITLVAEAGQTLYFVIDASDSGGGAGLYTFTLEAGAP